MIRFLLIFISIFLFAKDTNLTLQLNWKYQFENAGFIIAKEKGFYKKENLNVILKEKNKNINIVDYVLDHNNTIGISTSSLLKYIAQKTPIKVLMPTLESSPIVLAIIGYKNIHSLKDIEKYHIPITNRVKNNIPILAMLKLNKLNINKLNFVNTSPDEYLYKKGAYIIFLSDEPYILNKRKIPYKIFNPKDYGFTTHGNILFTSQKFADKNPYQIEKFLKATKKGFNYAFNHIPETINIILKKYNTQNKTYDELAFEAKALKPLIGFDFNHERVKILKSIYILAGLINNQNINVRNYLFNIERNKYQNFIKNHIIRCISTTKWPPFNFKVNGEYKGIAFDYWKYIKKESHLKSRYITVNSFKEALDAIKNKKADVLLATGITSDRQKYALFTKPYVTFPFVIATRNDIGFIENINILKNKKIAVGKDYTAEKILSKYYPSIKLLLVKDTKEALKAVEEGKAFGAIDILPVISFNINKFQFSTLKISGRLHEKFGVRFMVRKDYPELVTILNDAINNIPEEEKLQIAQKWIPVIYEKGFSLQQIKKYLIIGTMIIFIFILWIIFKEIESNKRKKLEIQLIKEKEKAQEAEKIKSEFLANMSHEIRTPLNAMFGFIQLLQQKKLDDETKKYLNIIEKSGQNLLSIINDILDFSKLEAGKLHIENITFNPKEEIDVLYNLFIANAKSKNINLNKIEKNLNYNIISDPTRLKQIIANLLSNAIKFTPENKNITLFVKYDDKNETLCVEVKDQGIGIPKEKIKNIFQSFSQVDSSTTRKYGGTGLGLSISYKLTELLGGTLKVKSKLHKGSKFYFTIPAKKGSPISKKEKKTTPIKHTTYNYHILVVEDNKANQMFMKVLLKQLGITFDIANDGIEAIELFKNNKYDLILMDENMPNMNGIEATKQIRLYEKENKLTPTKISALTANAFESDKERFILAGMDFYLSKPLDIEKLKEILEKLK